MFRLGEAGRHHILTADGNVAVRSALSCGKRVRSQEMRSESAGINDFGSTLTRRTPIRCGALGPAASEPVFTWHPFRSLLLWDGRASDGSWASLARPSPLHERGRQGCSAQEIGKNEHSPLPNRRFGDA